MSLYELAPSPRGKLSTVSLVPRLRVRDASGLNGSPPARPVPTVAKSRAPVGATATSSPERVRLSWSPPRSVWQSLDENNIWSPVDETAPKRATTFPPLLARMLSESISRLVSPPSRKYHGSTTCRAVTKRPSERRNPVPDHPGICPEPLPHLIS